MHLPALVVHADWSIHPRKRWMIRAARADDAYTLSGPSPVGALDDLLLRLHEEAAGGGVLLGLDLPIGVPAAWAALAGVDAFTELFPKLGEDAPWESFYDVAEDASEISLHRPFYPKRPGGTRQQHLLDGLGLTSASELRRACDYPSNSNASPCPMFWTMGANQVGKAAITAWRDALLPAVRHPELDVALWPFDGRLDELMQSADVVVAEVYPGEVGGWFELDMSGGGKRKQVPRAQNAPVLEGVLSGLGVTWEDALLEQLRDGFGERPDGEDPFDATIGLVGMLAVLHERQPLYEPPDGVLRDVEGWLLGRPE